LRHSVVVLVVTHYSHFRDDLPSHSLNWCNHSVFPTNSLSDTSKVINKFNCNQVTTQKSLNSRHKKLLAYTKLNINLMNL